MSVVFRIGLISIFTFSLLVIAYGQSDLETFLASQEDLTYESIGKGDVEKYMVQVTQPVDHKNASGPSFTQRVILTHASVDRPTVIQTQGYNVSDRKNEIVEILGGNSLNVEHRFFAKSVPEDKDWRYLTLEQATADLHKIRTIFEEFYTDKWVATGISKGGATTIYYEYFYPEDTDASIAYVAPISSSIEDKRIYKFLDTIGTAEDRKRICKFQKYMFKNKDKVLDRLKWFAKGKGQTFDYLDGIEAAYEFAVLEYPFSIWQWGTAIEEIPIDKDLDKAIDHLMTVVGLDFYDDKTMDFFAAHYYQASTQMGYYGFETAKFSRWIDKVGKNPSASFYPKDSNPTFDPSLAKSLEKWLDKDGNDLLYINGLYDTWAACRVLPSKRVNSKAYNLSHASHGDARIVNMKPEMKEDFKEKLEEMLNRKVNLSVLEDEES